MPDRGGRLSIPVMRFGVGGGNESPAPAWNEHPDSVPDGGHASEVEQDESRRCEANCTHPGRMIGETANRAAMACRGGA